MNIIDDINRAIDSIRPKPRMVVCAPELEDRVNQLIEDMGLSGIITVVGTPACAKTNILVIEDKREEYASFSGHPININDTDRE